METSNYRIGGIEEEFSVDRLSDTGMELHLNFPPHKNTFLFDIEKDGEIEDYAKQFTYHTYITGNAKETLLSVICHFTIVLRHGLLCYDFQDLLIGYRNYNHIYGRIFDDEQLIEYVKGNDLKYKYIFIIFHFNEDYIKNNDMNYITKFYETLYNSSFGFRFQAV